MSSNNTAIKNLISWSKKEFSHLPWRKNRSLYRTLVSEIMLQQTTVSTVLNHFERFINIFPDIDSLANSSEEKLTIEWKGLGYYRRARNLHKACRYFQENFQSKIPLDFSELIKAPGVYTANAILAIGANENTLCVDANLERVLSRLNLIEMQKGPKLIKKINSDFKKRLIANEINFFGGRDYNEALMDLGRVYCQARKADCLICPMNSACLAFKSTDPLLIPGASDKKPKKYFDLKLLRLIVLKEDKILSYKKSDDQWLSGQFELPSFVIESEDENLNQYPKLTRSLDYDLLPMVKTSITKYRISNFVLICSEDEFKEITNCKLDQYQYIKNDTNANLTTASTKSLAIILQC